MEFEEYVVDLNADCICGCMDGDRFHKIFHFPNDYGASVIGKPRRPGAPDREYRILLLKFLNDTEYKVITVPMFDSTVVDCGGWADVAVSLKKIKEL